MTSFWRSLGSMFLLIPLWAQNPVGAPSSTPGLPKDVVERAVIVGTGEWALEGTLSLPPGKSPFPAAILVHGSGPGDRDETIGLNKPFRDIAWGLAARGIAVLRFDKRTRVYGARMEKRNIAPTIKSETLDDALLAAERLRQQPEVDPKRLYIIGHSMGASLAPWIGNAVQAAGVVMIAGSPRKPGEMIADQAAFVLNDPKSSEDQKREAREIASEAEKLRQLPSDETAIVLGRPVSYWRFWDGYDLVRELRKSGRPILILQGGRDYQVTARDFEPLRTAVEGIKAVTTKTYPTLNHLLQEGEGVSTPKEYGEPKPVAACIIEDIAAWIKSRGS
jgi:dienelactone hydrolase